MVAGLHRLPIDHLGGDVPADDTRAVIDDAVHQTAGHSIARAAGTPPGTPGPLPVTSGGSSTMIAATAGTLTGVVRTCWKICVATARCDCGTIFGPGGGGGGGAPGGASVVTRKCTTQSLRRNQRGQQRTADQQRLPGEPHRGGPNPFGGWTVGKCCRLKHGVLLSLRRTDTLRASKKIAGNAPQRPLRLVVVIAFNLHPNRHHVVRKVSRVETVCSVYCAIRRSHSASPSWANFERRAVSSVWGLQCFHRLHSSETPNRAHP